MIYTAPGQAGALVSFKSRYDNFIGGDWVAPAPAAISRTSRR